MTHETLEQYRSHPAFRLKAGKTALAILDATVDAGGKHSKRALVGLGERDRFAIYRGLQVLLDLGLIKVRGDLITLRRNWAKRLEPMPELQPLSSDEFAELYAFKPGEFEELYAYKPGELEAYWERNQKELEKFWAQAKPFD